MGYEGDTIKDECIADETAQREYLDNYRVYTYVSEAKFDPQKFGDESIRRYSKFNYNQVAKGQNVYMNAYARETLLEDESDFLQLGQTSESTFYGFSLDPPKSSSWN